MKEKIKKHKKLFIIISCITLVLLLAGVYALISWTTRNYNISLNTACFNINYSKGQDIEANLKLIDESDYVDFDNNIITIGNQMAFSSVSLELDSDCNYFLGEGTIEINTSNLSTSFTEDGDSYGALKYVVAEYNPEDYDDLTIEELEGESFDIVSSGSITTTDSIDAYTMDLYPGEVNNYLVIFYIDINNAGEDILSSTFSSRIDSRAEQVDIEEASYEDFDYVLGSDVDGYVTEVNAYIGDGDIPLEEVQSVVLSDDYKIELASNEILLTRYIGDNPYVSVPDTYTIDGIEYNIVMISSLYFEYEESYYVLSTFKANYNIVGVFLDSNVLFFGEHYDFSLDQFYQRGTMDGAFFECFSLEIMPVIPSTVTSIQGLFESCVNLTKSPVIPNLVTNMNYTFYGCSSLTEAPVIPRTVADMNYTFAECTNLSGTIRIENTNLENIEGIFDSVYNDIIVEVPNGSTTYDSLNSYKPDNVTLVTY